MRATATETRDYPPEELLGWTPRQREVLALLAEGRTNAGIADELGISLDGAKWHVREVMSKLGVGSREEAADYWRWRNGLPTRLRTGRRRLAGLLLSRWAMGLAGAATLAGVGALVFFAVLVLSNRGEAEPSDAIEATMTLVPDASASPTAEASQSPAATVTAVASPTEDGVLTHIDGVPVHELTVAEPVPLPGQAVFYYIDTCIECIDSPLSRGWIDAEGSLVEEPLIAGGDSRFPEGYPMHLIHDGAGRFAVAWCLTAEYGPCGKHNPDWDRIPELLLVSEDGGVTWENRGELPPRTWLIQFDGEEVLAATVDPDAGGLSHALYPSGSPVDAPNESSGETIASNDKELVFRSDIDATDPLTYPPTTYLWVSDHGTLASDYYAFPGGNVRVSAELSPTVYVGSADRNNKAAFLSGDQDVLSGFAFQSIVIDLGARTIAPIEGFIAEDGMASGISFLSAVQGPVVRVTGAGDCLNVREGASLDCYADGVILRDRGEETDAEGEMWLAVVTPDRREGWASAAFLAPLFGDDSG